MHYFPKALNQQGNSYESLNMNRLGNYHPPTELWTGNVFSCVCLLVQGRILYCALASDKSSVNGQVLAPVHVQTCSTPPPLPQCAPDYEAWNVGKRMVGIRLKCLFVFKVFITSYSYHLCLPN